jgi:beta-1,2-mannobiose phosphorylase / 1,2-beta-oligomannan phosphorylase
MFTIKKSPHNPLLSPNTNDPWEAKSVFNWCPVKDGRKTHYVYRAMSSTESYFGSSISISSIGYTSSKNGIDFSERRQLIAPEYDWEKYGCEDPRVTKIDNKFYIFYTALSNYPYNAECIKIAVAITKDFKKIEEKHLVTPFNAKAMALFPEKINGKYVVVLSVNTDLPPAKICFAEFDNLEDMWNKEYWDKWYKELDLHSIDPRRSDKDHVEVGAPPIKTKDGWLFIYSHIENYFKENNPFVKVFGIETLLLDLKNPKKIIGRTIGPMFVPSEVYEKFGQIPDIIFPSGAMLNKNVLDIYYGAADTVCSIASVNLNDLLNSLKPDSINTYFTRYDKNPILVSRPGVSWEAHGVFNPASIRIDGVTHILYRTMSDDDTSYIGYASSKNGYDIDERGSDPIYVPRESFEMKTHPGNSGCEDPRLTLIDNIVYMCYTAYDGTNPPRVAITSILLQDFKNKKWNWTKPVLISPNNKDDKDACIFPEKIDGKYLMLHRINNDVCADFIDSLDIIKGPLEIATPILLPRKGMWDSEKVGITAPPIKTSKGWILLYHGVSSNHHTYRVGLALLDLKNPLDVIARVSQPIFQPETSYEKVGVIPNVVFPCGVSIIKENLFIYYGGADSVVGVATVSIKKLLDSLL